MADNKNSNIYLKASTNFKNVAGQINDNLKTIRTSVSSTILKFAGIATAITGIGVSFMSLKKIFTDGIALRVNTENAENDIAGLIGSVYKIRDATGELTKGQEKYTLAIKESQRILAGFETAGYKLGIDPNELANSFKQSIDAANNAGVSSSGLQQLVTAVSALYKSRGDDTARVGQDLNDALSGKVKENSTLGKSLNLGNSLAYKKALETNTVMKYIVENVDKALEGTEAIEDSLGDAFDKIKKSFDQISKGAVEELSKQLKLIALDFSSMFDENGVPTKGLDKVIALLNVLGGLVGQGMRSAFKLVYEWIEKASNNIESMFDYIDTGLIAVNGVGSAFTSVFNILSLVVQKAAELSSNISDNVADISNANNRLTDQQKVLKFINAGWTGIRVAITGVVEGIGVLFTALRSVSSMLLGGILKPFNNVNLILAGMAAYNKDFDKAAEHLKQFSDADKRIEKLQKDLAGEDNPFSQKNPFDPEKFKKDTAEYKQEVLKFNAFNKKQADNLENYFKSAFSSTGDAFLSGFETDQALSDINNTDKDVQKNARKILGIPDQETYQNIKTDFEKKQKEIKELREKNERDLKNGKTGDPTEASPTNQFALAKMKEDLNARLETLKTSGANEKAAFEDQLRYQDLYFSNNLISLTKYYNDKKSIEDSAYRSNLDNLNKQLEVLEAQKKLETDKRDSNNSYDSAGVLALDNKIIQQKQEIDSLTKEYSFNATKGNLEQAKAIREQNDALDGMIIKIKDLDGLTSESKKLTLDIELRGLKEQYQNNPEMLNLLNDYYNSASFKNQVDDFNNTVSDLFSKNDTLEERSNILLNNKKISELENYKQISKIRKNTYEELVKQQKDLEVIYNKTQDPKVKNELDQVKNKVLELGLTLDPLADKFRDIFDDKFGTLFDDLIDGTKTVKASFQDFFKDLENEVQKFVSKQLAADISKSLFNFIGGGDSKKSGGDLGSTFGSLISSFFGGGSSSGGGSGATAGGWMSSIAAMFYAGGGNVPKNQLSLVGENGPELIYTRQAATVMNNNDTNRFLNQDSRGGDTIMNFNFKNTDSSSFRASQMQIATELKASLAK